MFRIALALFALALVACAALAQCGAGGCFAPSPPAASAQSPAAYQWRKIAEKPTDSALFLGGRQVGGYDHPRGIYYPLSGNAWGEPCPPPVAPPAWAGTPPPAKVAKQPVAQQPGPPTPPLLPPNPPDLPESEPPDWRTHGVAWQMIPDRESIHVGPRKLDSDETIRLLNQVGDPTLPDDAAKRHVTGIARDAAGAKKLADSLAPLAADYRVQVYDLSRPVDAALMEPFKLAADTEFQRAGMVVLMQEPEGVDGMGEVRPNPVYGDGPDVVDKVRKMDPNYDPNKNRPAPPAPPVKPDDKKSPAAPDSSSGTLPVAVGIAGAALLLLLRKR